MNIKPKLWALALASIPFVQSAQATVTDTWICESGNWNSSCWFTSLAIISQPQTGDDVNLSQSGSTNLTVTYNATNSANFNQLTVDATGSGTMTLIQNNNTLSASTEYIGFLGAGTFNQSSGTNRVSNLNLGYSIGSIGTYNLGGTGSVSAGTEKIAYLGTGNFNQNGGTNTINNLNLGYSLGSTGTYNQSSGTNTVDNLNLGYELGSTGTYNQSGGTLKAGTITSGSGSSTFNLDGGKLSLSTSGSINVNNFTIGNDAGSNGSFTLGSGQTLTASVETIGNNGTGTLSQTGGTNTLSVGSLFLGYGSGTGTYNLGGTGSLSASIEYIGYAGTGVFSQSGGTNTVIIGSGSFILGYNSDSTYNLSGTGSLIAGTEYIGYDGIGNFNQSGGTNTIGSGYGSLYLGYSYNTEASTYNLSGTGSLSADNEYIGMSSTGNFNQSGGTNTIGGGNGSLNLGYNSNTTASTYNLSGTGSLIAGSEYIGYGGSGLFNQSGGTNTVGSGSGSLTLSGYQKGTYNLSGGTLNVGSIFGGGGLSTFNLDGGKLSLSTSGSINVNNFTIGNDAGSNGSFTLGSGQTLTAFEETIGESGIGTLTQSGGSNTLSGDNLFLGYYSGSTGTYNLSGTGVLSASSENIGTLGTGIFNQSGGTNTVGSGGLNLGYADVSSGTYNLSGGILNVGSTGGGAGGTLNGGGILNVSAIEGGMASTFNLDGGTLNIAGGSVNVNSFNIGNAAGSNGIFTLSDGVTITADNETLGLNGLGSLTQTGGRNTAGSLTINNGSYTLSGGSLTINTSMNNSDTFNLAGDTLNGSGALVNNALMSGFGAIAGSGGFTNNGLFTQTGGNLTLSNTGTNANTGNMDLASGLQLRLNGCTLNNTGTLNVNGALITGSGTLSNNLGGTIAGRGSITSSFSNAGNVAVSGGTLNIKPAFTNSGTIELGGAGTTLAGGLITNSSTIQGVGNAGNAINNSGTIEAIGGGVLNLTGTLNNNLGGVIRATTDNKVLAMNGIASNNGLISLTGGTVDTNGKSFTSAGQITGYGVLASGGLTNSGSMTFSGGTSTLNGNVTNAVSGTIQVSNSTAVFTGNVINDGLINTTAASVIFAGGLTVNGAYLSDPTITILTDLNIGVNGYLSGGSGDVWQLSGSFINDSRQNTLWNTSASSLVLNGSGVQSIYLAGSNQGASISGYSNNFAWGDLTLSAGTHMDITNTNGAALYVRVLQLAAGVSQLADIYSAENIYYLANLAGNAYLGDKNYALAGGGELMAVAAVPLPQTWVLMLAGLGFLGYRQHRNQAV
jgi:hypothetical protein